MPMSSAANSAGVGSPTAPIAIVAAKVASATPSQRRMFESASVAGSLVTISLRPGIERHSGRPPAQSRGGCCGDSRVGTVEVELLQLGGHEDLVRAASGAIPARKCLGVEPIELLVVVERVVVEE